MFDTPEPLIPERLPYILVGLFFLSVWWSLYTHDPDEIDMKMVSEWEHYRLDEPEPIPTLPDRVITHIKVEKKGSVLFGSPRIEFITYTKYKYGWNLYKKRSIYCSKGWYNRTNKSPSFETVAGTGNDAKGTMLYIQGADRDEKLEFDYLCKKYTD